MPELIDLSSIKAENTNVRKQAVTSVVTTLQNEIPSLNGFISPMRGGKTTAATETYESLIADGRKVLVAKMDFDQRGDADYSQVWTRERNKSSYMDAHVIKGIAELTGLISSADSPVKKGDIITLIEAPFMEKRPGELDTFLRTARAKEISLVIDGLVSWYNGIPIPQMQTILRNSYYEQSNIHLLRGYDVINGEVAEFNARGVNVTGNGEVLDSDAKYYLNQPREVMQALVKKFQRSQLYNYHLRNTYEKKNGETVPTLLLPSHPYLDDPIVIENVRYLTISEKTFHELYTFAGIKFEEPPKTASSIFTAALNLHNY